MGAPERIVHTGSVSKTLAPALRLGWSIAPAGLRDQLLEAKFASDISSPALSQLTVAVLLADGSYERHLRTSRRHQRRRRDALVDAVHRHLPDARVAGVAAGLHVLVTFDGRCFDDVAVARRIRAGGIVVEPLSPHRSADGPPGLILGHAPHPPDRLEDAVARIAKFLRE